MNKSNFFFRKKEHLPSLKNINHFVNEGNLNQSNIKKNNHNHLYIRCNIFDILLNPLFIFFFPFFLSHCNSLHFIITGNFSSTSLDFDIHMNNFCCNPKTRYFIRRERIPIYFLSPLCTFCTPFYRTFRFFNRLSLLYLSTSTSPYTSLYLHEYHSFMVLYYIFFLFPLNPRQTVRLHFAFIPFLFLSYVYIYIYMFHRDPQRSH